MAGEPQPNRLHSWITLPLVAMIVGGTSAYFVNLISTNDRIADARDEIIGRINTSTSEINNRIYTVATRIAVLEAKAAEGPRFTEDQGSSLRRELEGKIKAHVEAGPHDDIEKRVTTNEAEIKFWGQREDNIEARLRLLERDHTAFKKAQSKK